MLSKTCKICQENKQVSEFHISRWGLYGVKPVCKLCRKDQNREYAKRIKADDKNYDITEKRCTYCKKIKPRDEMIKNITKKDGMNSQCIECCRKDTCKKPPKVRAKKIKEPKPEKPKKPKKPKKEKLHHVDEMNIRCRKCGVVKLFIEYRQFKPDYYCGVCIQCCHKRQTSSQ